MENQLNQINKKATPTIDRNASSSVFKERARTLKENIGLKAGLSARRPTEVESIRNDPIVAYQRKVRQMGAEKVGERLASITDMWNSKNSPYNGSDIIYQLLMSDYTLDEINYMTDEAHTILFDSKYKNYGERPIGIENVRHDLQTNYSLSDEQWGAFQELFRMQEEGEIPTMWETDPVGTALMFSMLVPGFQGVGVGSKLLAKVASLAKAGGKVTTVMSGFGVMAQAEEENRLDTITAKQVEAEQKLKEATDPLMRSGVSAMHSFQQPSLYDDAQQLRLSLAEWNKDPESRDDIKAMQKYFQENGVGEDLEADGILDYSWQGEIMNVYSDVIRSNYELQRQCIADGDADYWADIDGDLTSEYWTAAVARRETRLAENEAKRTENPDRYAFWEKTGIPTTKLGMEALQRKLAKNGFLQEMYGSLLKTAETIGTTYQAVGSAINLYVRQQKDPDYQRLLNNLTDYVDAQALPDDDTWGRRPQEANETYARYAVTKGALRDDPKAQELLSALDQQQAALIDERYAPDYLLTLGYLINGDYNEVYQFGKDHPDLVSAFTVGVDVTTAVANSVGKMRRAIMKPKVKPTAQAFTSSNRAQMMTKRVANYLVAKDFGRASHYVKGTAASTVLGKLWTPMGKNADRVSSKSKIITDIAREVVDAVDDGNITRVTKILEGADDGFVESVVQAASTATRSDVRGWVGSQAERAMIERKISGLIAKRQNNYSDAITTKVLAARLADGLAKEWGKGADIFPYLRDNRLSSPNRPLAFLTKSITEVKNDWTREFLTKALIGPVVRAPTAEIELQGLNTLDRVYDAAVLISQDAAWAWNFRNRWAAAKSETSLKRLVEELDAKYTAKFKKVSQEGRGIRERAMTYFGEASESGGQALAPEPRTGSRFLTEYGTGSKTRQAVPDTTYMQYMAQLHRSALWAPYNTAGASTLGKAVLQTKNIYRGAIWTAHFASTPLRQWTVAMGAPLLFQKHALTDSFRTAMEETPFSLLEAAGLKGLSVKGITVVPKLRSSLTRRMDTIMEQLPATLRDEITYTRARVHASEAQWLSGVNRHVYRPKTIRDKSGNITNLNDAAHALRRIASGEAFKQWAEGGPSAVREWLTNTRDGKRFLVQGDWINRAKYVMDQAGLETKGKTAEVRARAIEEYMDTVVRQEFEVLSTSLGGMMPTLKRMALNNELMGVEALKQLIKDNPGDNAVLSFPANEMGKGSGYAGYIVGKAMAANKWNRDVVFDHVFLDQYRKMTKEGVSSENAARAAATVAELNTARIHFDLSNALAIEARHRWLAWFATKHRLYGTYVMKLAADRPMIAAAAMNIKDWMAERNERLGVSEYDKYDLVLNVGGGQQIRLNLAPLMWLSEYPLESSLAAVLEQGAAWTADQALGWDLHPSPTPFGMSFTRADNLVLTIADVVTSNKVDTEEDLQSWLNSLSADKRTRWNKLINNQRAVSIAQGKELTPIEAFNKAKAAAVVSELWSSFKIYSGRVYTDKSVPGAQPIEKLEIERLLEEFSNLSESDPDAAKQMLRENRTLAAALNVSMDPVEKASLDEGFRIYNQLLSDYQAKLESAADLGTLPVVYTRLNEDFRNEIEKMCSPMYENYNEAFAKYYGDNNPQEFIDALGVLLPLVPAESIWKTGRAKTTLEKDEYQSEQLEPVFEEQLDMFGIADTDHSTPLYHILRDMYIDEPLAKWSGESAYDLAPRTAQSAARYLARGGETGVYKADAFLEVVADQTKMEFLGRGIINGKSSTPLMALLSPEEKELIYYNSNPQTRTDWYKWAVADWTVKKYRKEHGLGTNSNAYKELRAQVDTYANQLAAANPDFAEELTFSRLRMHERLLAYGVGSGTDAVSKAWGEFLNITTDYWYELDNVVVSRSKTGVGPTAQHAYSIAQKYLPQIAELAKDNQVWWAQFRSSFTLNKFGYYWWSPDDVDDFLHSGKWKEVTEEEIREAEEEAEEEEWW